MSTLSPRPPRRTRRIILISVGAVLAVVLVVLALAPTIAGSIAPGIAANAINSSINGKATVSGVSLSWFGGQTIGPVTVADAAGKQVASVNLKLSKGLFALARGGMGLSAMDLGEIQVSGSADLVRHPDGTLNIASLAKPAPAAGPSTPGAPSSQPAAPSLPAGLRARLVIDALQVRYTDEGAKAGGVQSASLPELKGTASIDSGNAAADIKGEVFYQTFGQDKPVPGGSLSVDAKATGFADSSGRLTPDAAKIDATIQAKDVAVAVADALAGLDNRLVAGIGDKLQATLKASGTLADADATVAANTSAITVDLAFKSAGGVLVTPRPGVISVKTGGMMPLIPGLEDSLKKQDNVTLQRLPDITATLDKVRIPLPLNGKPLDLRGGTFALAIQSTETLGSVRVPQPDGSAGQPQAYRLAPITASLTSEDLGKKILFIANTAATLGGQSAGTLAADLAAIEPLDAAGKPRTGMPGRVQGNLNLTGVATAIAQPFLASSGVDVAKDIGPTLDLALKAAAGDEEGAAPVAAGAPTPTHLALDLKAANLVAVARLQADAKTVRTKPRGIEVQMVNAGLLATRSLAKAGMTIDSTMPVTITIKDLVADLDRLAPSKPGAGADLRALTGVVTIQTGTAAGKLAVAGQPARVYEIKPLLATLDAKDLGKGVTLKADTSATLEGAPAGTVAVNLAATGLLAADGSLAPGLPAVNGTVAITEISTAIAQPFVEGAGLDLPAGVGPKLAVNLTATSKGGAASAAGGIPPTDLDVNIKSAGVNSTLALALDGRTVTKRGGEGVLSIKSPGTLAGKAARASGVALGEGGYAKATVRDLALKFDEKWAPLYAQSRADVEINVGGFSVGMLPKAEPGKPAAPAVEPVALNQFIATAKLAPDATPALTLKGSGSHRNAAFFTQGDLQLVGLIGKDSAGNAVLTPANVRPLGTVDVNNLPTSIVGAFVPPTAAGPDGGPGMDVAKLIRDAVGPTATMKFASIKPATGGELARDVSMTVTSASLNGSAAAVIDDRALALNKLDFTGNVTQELAATVIDMLGSGLASTPKLASPASLRLTATPFTVPLAAGKPDFARASGDASFKVGLEGRTLVDNVVLKGENGQNRNVGTVGLENVMLTADVPLRALAAGSAAAPARAKITGGVLAGADRRIVDLAGGGQVNLASGKPDGDLNADVTLKLLDAAWVDTFINQPGLIAGGVGENATVQASAVVKFPPASAAPPAGSAAPAFQTASVNASIKSPRLVTSQPLKATLVPDRASLDSPLVVKWTMDPEWATKRLLIPADAKPGYQPPAVFAAPTEVTVSVFKLGVSTASDGAPLKPGVFIADASIESPGTTLTVGTGKSATQAVVKNFKTRVTGGKDPGTLGFSLTVDDAGGGSGAGGKPAVQLAGGVYSVSDAQGKVTADKAKITANGTAAGIPTVLVDALAQQNGLITEALGPTANLDIKAEGLSRTSGKLNLVATSPRADAQVQGNIRDGALVTTGQPDVKLKIITPELGGMIVKGLPMVGTFQKQVEDGPAIIQATGLVVPIDGQVQKLNGTVVLDLGKARFATSNVFSKLLKLAGQKESGSIGRKLEPVTVNIKDGVAVYDRVTIPLGEFNLATRGTVDLVQKRLDVITYIPFGALTDEAAGMFNTGLGKALGGAIPGIEKATMMPFRTSGSFEKHETKPDLELFGKEFINNIRPDKAIPGLLDDLLKKKKDK